MQETCDFDNESMPKVANKRSSGGLRHQPDSSLQLRRFDALASFEQPFGKVVPLLGFGDRDVDRPNLNARSR